jgi:hypothetical protein
VESEAGAVCLAADTTEFPARATAVESDGAGFVSERVAAYDAVAGTDATTAGDAAQGGTGSRREEVAAAA